MKKTDDRKNLMSVIAENLKKYRELKGLTQQQMWESAKISKSAYTSYEAGKSMPSAERVLRFAEILEVTTDQILKNEEVPLSKDLEFSIRKIQELPIELQKVAKTALRGLVLGLEQEAMRG